MFKPYDYQTRAVNGIDHYLCSGMGNPVLEAPPGSGKSIINAMLIPRCFERLPGARVWSLTHVKELITQNVRAFHFVNPGWDFGMMCAGLDQYDTDKAVTFGTIQTMRTRARYCPPPDILIVDEAHLIPVASRGRYRSLIDEIADRRGKPPIICGLTATPYRLDNGLLTHGRTAIFDTILPASVFGMSIPALIDAGRLAPLTTEPVQARFDYSNVSPKGYDFDEAETRAIAEVFETVEAVVKEIIAFGQDRRRWLIFAVSIEQANMVGELLQQAGISAAAVHSWMTKGQRDTTIQAFRDGHLRALVNVNILTTGFDVPAVDLLAMLRGTLSTALYVQMMGRGLRVAPGKSNCLVLDFAENIDRHGPINAVSVTNRVAGDGQAPEKLCEGCGHLVPIQVKACPFCGYEFVTETPEKKATLSTSAPIADDLPPYWEVSPTRLTATRHQKAGKPDSIKMTYLKGRRVIAREWLCPNHEGIPRRRFYNWWAVHVGGAIPDSLEQQIIAINQQARLPAWLIIDTTGRYNRIVTRKYDDAALTIGEIP